MRNAILIFFCVGLYFVDVMAFPSCSTPTEVSVYFFVDDDDDTPYYELLYVQIGSLLSTDAVPDPVREGYTFAGWYRIDGVTPFLLGVAILEAGNDYYRGDDHAIFAIAHWEELPVETPEEP